MDALTPRRLGAISTASLTPPTPAIPATAAPAASVLGRDTLQLGVRRSELEEEVKKAEQITGKPVAFKTPAEQEAYLKSIEVAEPEGAYDRTGFLKDVLGVSGVRASGRQDRPTLEAVRQFKDYRPDDKILGSKLPQQFFFDIATAHPGLFLALTKVANPLMEAPGEIRGNWKKPFTPNQTVHPSDVKPAERYPQAYPHLQEPLHFADDFHFGTTGEDGGRPYGTYAIAQSLGFTAEQAKRIAATDNGIDFNSTPYGKSSYMPLDEIDRHFNLDRDGEDTRLVWAGNHLQAAIDFGRQGSFDEAEIELGAGLHSLQDFFAHGQLTPAVHATIGEFPDNVQYNPIAVYEATLTTMAYMRAYLRAIAIPAS